MTPQPNTDSTGSGPVDGEEIKMNIAPHHQKHPHNQGPSIVQVALTGAAVVGGIVGLYMLYKRFFGRRNNPDDTNDNARPGKLVRRTFGGDIEEEVRAVYDEALQDEGFLEFLEEFEADGLFE
jgi:hypothetical protein